MKQKLLTLLTLSLLAIGQVWGASPLTLTMSQTSIGNVTSLTNQAKTISGYELYFTSVTSAGTNFVQLAKNSSLYNKTAIPGAISSIKLSDCATTSTKTDGGYTVYGSTDGSSWTEIGSITGLSSTAADKSTNFTGSYSYFKITVNSARVLKISSIEISYSSGPDKTSV